MLCLVAQLCPTLGDPTDGSPPGSAVHGILQARILEWVAISSFRASSRPRYRTCVSYVSCIGRQVLYHWHHLGSPVELRLEPKSVNLHSESSVPVMLIQLQDVWA